VQQTGKWSLGGLASWQGGMALQDGRCLQGCDVTNRVTVWWGVQSVWSWCCPAAAGWIMMQNMALVNLTLGPLLHALSSDNDERHGEWQRS